MHNESDDVLDTLIFTVNLIKNANDHERQRLMEAYADAQVMVADIALDHGSARPRIIACFKKFSVLKAAEDITAASWMLTAIQARIGEHDLVGWQSLKIVADEAAMLLRPTATQIH